MFTYRDHEDQDQEKTSKTASNNTSTTSSTTENPNDLTQSNENYVRIGNSPKSKKEKKKN